MPFHSGFEFRAACLSCPSAKAGGIRYHCVCPSIPFLPGLMSSFHSSAHGGFKEAPELLRQALHGQQANKPLFHQFRLLRYYLSPSICYCIDAISSLFQSKVGTNVKSKVVFLKRLSAPPCTPCACEVTHYFTGERTERIRGTPTNPKPLSVIGNKTSGRSRSSQGKKTVKSAR